LRKFLNMTLDILSYPFSRAWLRIISIRIPILPGQLWEVPGVGIVLVRMTDKDNIYYTAIESEFYEGSYEIILKANRIEFLAHCTRYSGVNSEKENETSEEIDDKNIVNMFDFKKKEDE
jgi:hypothetical protein